MYKAARRRSTTRASGKGPVFLVVETYRLVGHFVGDAAGLPPEGGAGASCARRRIRSTKLREKLGLSDDELEAMDAEVLEIVEASVEFAKNGTDPKPEDALKNVYA